jgi:transcriptional regulator with XRE-family HTH domain
VASWVPASDIGDRLRELREYLGELRGKPMNQEEFGDLMGVSNQRVSDWEVGRGTPARNRLERIGKRLGIPLTVFAANGPRPRDVVVRHSPSDQGLHVTLDALNTRLAWLRDQFRSYHDNGMVPDGKALELWLGAAQAALEFTNQPDAELPVDPMNGDGESGPRRVE